MHEASEGPEARVVRAPEIRQELRNQVVRPLRRFMAGTCPCHDLRTTRMQKGRPLGALFDSTPQPSPVVLERHPDGFETLGARHHLHADALAFRQVIDAFAGEHRAMDEDILAAVHRNEAEALFRIVPFDLAVDFLGWPGRPMRGALPRRRPAAASTATESRTARRLRRAGMDGGAFGDLRALGPLPNPHRQGGARFERGMPGTLDDADVQKGLA